MAWFKSYLNPDERRQAESRMRTLLFEGLLLGGTGLGVFALIFEIAADAFSVAAYQTLLAIHGAHGNHDIAMLAFVVLSVMLFFGVVPAYKAGAYLRPTAGGSGPLVEAIGPVRLHWLSWVGTSLFFLDAILTIIISSISAADVTMLILPELADYRILLAEIYALFIMAVLVSLGPRRAVPLFLIGGGAFTIFTLFALLYSGFAVIIDSDLALKTLPIIERLEATRVAEITETIEVLSAATFFQFFLRSMSSAMLGFSGYEMIPASGKHAAFPKWKVINSALTLAAVFLIGTGIIQLYAASRLQIPATEGYSTLLIIYEVVFGPTFLLTTAGVLLAIILLMAQGGGYVGGAAVAANAARLGRLPAFFHDDRIGIAVIWGLSATAIPIIREVVIVEAYYAFGFVTAFAITGTTIFFVRDDVLRERGIEPSSDEAKSLRFAGLRGMVASYLMLVVLITQKTNALAVIVTLAGLLTLLQYVISRGGLTQKPTEEIGLVVAIRPGKRPQPDNGLQRALDEARQRGIADLVMHLFDEGAMVKFNVELFRIQEIISFTYGIQKQYWDHREDEHEVRYPEPSLELEQAYQDAFSKRDDVLHTIEHYSHYGIFTFIEKYYQNWLSENRDAETVQRAMMQHLFPLTPLEEIWREFQHYRWTRQPEPIWQFARERYRWAKDQWPNVSTRVTTIWTLQDLGLLPLQDDQGRIIGTTPFQRKDQDEL